MAERLGLVDLRVHALTTIGSAKEFLGDVTGREDLERAIEIARATSSPMIASALNNLVVVLDTHGLAAHVQESATSKLFAQARALRRRAPDALYARRI